MHLYKLLGDDDNWRATVCGTTEEAIALLGGRPDVSSMNGRGRNEQTEVMWGAPGTVFTLDSDVYPSVWAPRPPAA